MKKHDSRARRVVPRLLAAPLTVLALAASAWALPADSGADKDAARVAKRIEKSIGTARRAHDERKALAEFQENLDRYAKLHTRQLAKLGAFGDSLAGSQALAHALQDQRADAKPGDLFEPEVQVVLRRLMVQELDGPDAFAARRMMLEGNPGQEEDSAVVVIRVNAEYPAGAPRSSMPPSLLVALPLLPPSLRYLFVGRDLLLVDTVAQLVVDVLPDAAPEFAATTAVAK